MFALNKKALQGSYLTNYDHMYFFLSIFIILSIFFIYVYKLFYEMNGSPACYVCTYVTTKDDPLRKKKKKIILA